VNEEKPRDLTVEEIRALSPEEYLDWLDETGQDVDQFDLADEKAQDEIDAGAANPATLCAPPGAAGSNPRQENA
jgi:hypothetical protein